MKPQTYSSFLWKSNNAHGIHSPFVYPLVAEGFYNPKRVPHNAKNDTNASGLNNKALTTLFKTLWYFKSFKLMVLGEHATEATEAIRTLGEQTNTQLWFFSPLAPVSGGLDVGVITGSNTQDILTHFHRLLQDANGATVFALPGIHATAKMETAWKAIKKEPNVSVTIDTYDLGLIFIRKGQAKQHFTIRPFNTFFANAILGLRNLWGLLG